MNKVFYAVSLLLLTLSSCKKSNDGNGVGTISAAVDGTAVSFNTQAMAMNSSSGGVYALVINGFQGTVGSSNQVTITIGGTAPVTAGTYTDVVTSTTVNSVSFAYVQQPGNVAYAAMGEAPNTATVTVTKITATSVEGTFSGAVAIFSGSGSPANHTITNGKFNLAIKN